MAWESRERGGRYYTRSTKKNGRVIRQYIGCGLVGEIAALQDDRRRAEKQKQEQVWQEMRRPLLEVEACVKNACNESERIVRAVLEALGYHRDKNYTWRKRRSTTMIQDEQEIRRIHTTMTEAWKGDTKARDELKKICKAEPQVRELIKVYGKTADIALKKIQQCISGENLVQQEAIQISVEDMAEDISGPSASPLEKMLAHRIALCWLQINFADIAFNRNLSNCQHRKHIETLMQWQDRAHQRLLSAVKTLAQVRRLGQVTLQVNIAEKQINVATGREDAA